MIKNRIKPKIAIIGGGVAGSSAALYFGSLGLNVTLFEKEPSLVSGPPFCHLHAGGNFYREISDEQCLTLLRQSIDFLRFYPFVVDYRPTVIVVPKYDTSTAKALLPRLELLSREYEALIAKDVANKVLGESKDYYRSYSKEQIEALRLKEITHAAKTHDEWMIIVAKNIDLSKVQFPLILVQEYGLNLFRLAAGVELAIKNTKSATLNANTIVHNIQKDSSTSKWIVKYHRDEKNHQESFDYLINAAGFRAGQIDDMLNAPCKSMVEFKAAYISHWQSHESRQFPEIIFHGERGTPQGMGQFTPYQNGYFQLHGMTNDITLYENGLAESSTLSCQPNLDETFINKIEKSWKKEELEERTRNAIKHLAQFIPKFESATVGSRPLFGAQQIPGDDPTLRVAEVSFPIEFYARCEIVKVSSVFDMIDAISKNFIDLGYISKELLGKRNLKYLDGLDEESVKLFAENIAKDRGYPISLANRNIS